VKQRDRGKKPTKLRYSPEAAYARGGATRARLIATAIRLFGQRGFDGASTRDIATAAALNTPALQYYFDNKEGLYVACAEHLVSLGWGAMQDTVIGAERLLAEGAGDEALIEAFCAVQDRMADFLNDAGADWLLWMAREQTGLGSACGFLLGDRKVKRMLRVTRLIVARLLGGAHTAAECLVHDMALNGHLLYFHLMRPQALRRIGWRRIDASRLDLIKRITREHSLSALREMVAQRASAAASHAPAPRTKRGAGRPIFGSGPGCS
jgi:AcrR family transcriptional regulator